MATSKAIAHIIPLYIQLRKLSSLIGYRPKITRMASISSSVATVSRSAPAQANMVAPFTGLKSNAAFPTTKKANDFSTLPSNGGRVQCMKQFKATFRTAPAQANMVAPFTGLKSNAAFPSTKKANDFSTLPSNGGRVQCMKHGFVYRENARSPGYYDGRYWTMWKLPMFGC
ncbi:hypothetical protein M8C21_010730, partial [Ambrosia artemisiifolia]